MKWFDKWFAKKCRQAWDEKERPDENRVPLTHNQVKQRKGLVIGSNENTLSSQGTQFTLYSANGGTVVELRNYDGLIDRIQTMLYVIPSDKDLGQELGHILTMEALKR